MADEGLSLPINQNLDYHIVSLFEKLEQLRKDSMHRKFTMPKFNMQAEIRTLEFWRSIITECISSFFYVFIVCGAAAGAGVGASVSSVLLATALASGFTISALTQCFLHVSGANINPAVSIALALTRKISPLRAAMYMTAQCGGGIAGAALLYGVTVPGYQGNLQSVISHSSALPSWERFAVEFILTFIVVLTYMVSNDAGRGFGSTSLTIGAAYSACSFVSMPYLNPARSLGPSFVLNKWENHWVYWIGPLAGGLVSGIVYEYIYNPKRHYKKTKRNSDHDLASIHSDEDLTYDLDMDKSNGHHKIHGTNFTAFKAPTGTLTQPRDYCQSLYGGAPASKIDRVESIYGGTRSLYCKSPPLTRANLNRSQSVYAKSQTAINRDFLPPRPGPLVPAQSLYPMRITQTSQSSHIQNQNVQNQMQQRTDSIYGVRNSTRQQNQNGPLPPPPPPQSNHPPERITDELPSFQSIYGSRSTPKSEDSVTVKFERDDQSQKGGRITRPDSMYGMAGQHRGQSQSAQSDDSSYGSYHGPNSAITPTGRQTNSLSSQSDMMPSYGGKSRQQSQQQQIMAGDRKMMGSHSGGGGGGGGAGPQTLQSMQSEIYGTKSKNGGPVVGYHHHNHYGIHH